MADGQGTSQMETEQEIPNKACDDEIEKLIKIVNIIIKNAGETVATKIAEDEKNRVIDFDFSNELSGVLMTVFTCLRKQENKNGRSEKYLAYKAKLNGVEMAIDGLIELIKVEKISLNFLVATPIVELMTLFRPAFDEVCKGVTKFQVRSGVRGAVKKIVGSNNKEVWVQTLSTYGLNSKHIPLVQGITFPPERRTRLIRSLGPLAQAILLVQEDKYPDEIESALKNSLQMLPMAPEIARCLREAETSGTVQFVLRELGDLLLLTTSRPTKSIFLPLLILLKMWSVDYKKIGAKWSFSGVGAMLLYNEVTNVYQVTLKTGGASDHAAQVIFHACFGTYLDDLGVLSKITTHEAAWNKRKELNTVFAQRATQKSETFKLIQFKLFPKMAQALQTKSLGNVNPVSIGRPSFTGFRKRLFTGEFVNYMTTGKSSINFSSDPWQVSFALKKLKDNVLAERTDEKLISTGTKAWLEVNEKGELVESAVFPEENGTYFFGY